MFFCKTQCTKVHAAGHNGRADSGAIATERREVCSAPALWETNAREAQGLFRSPCARASARRC
ncbi:hypothetical protein D3C81_1881300 [compost metagenome]